MTVYLYEKFIGGIRYSLGCFRREPDARLEAIRDAQGPLKFDPKGYASSGRTIYCVTAMEVMK